MLARLLAAGLVLSAATGAHATAYQYTEAEAQVVFRAANEACLREDYKICLEGYERLLSAGYSGIDLQFNLGTANLKAGRLGPAILHLERALRLDPDDVDVLANLDHARRKQIDQLVGSGEEPLASRIVAHTRGDVWAAFFLGFWIAGIALLMVRSLAVEPGRRLALLLLGLGLVVASVPPAAVTFAHYFVNERAHEAVVLAPSLPVREGPHDGFKPAFEVHEGLKVRALDREGAFRRIRLSNGLQGWVPIEGLAEITPG